jgi:hypothetical protein
MRRRRSPGAAVVGPDAGTGAASCGSPWPLALACLQSTSGSGLAFFLLANFALRSNE